MFTYLARLLKKNTKVEEKQLNKIQQREFRFVSSLVQKKFPNAELHSYSQVGMNCWVAIVNDNGNLKRVRVVPRSTQKEYIEFQESRIDKAKTKTSY